jgi:hypothetical protein
MKAHFLFCLLLAPALHAAGPFATARLQPGRFVYRTSEQGKVIGTFTLTVAPQGDGTTLFTGEARGFNQHWRAATTPDFTPLFAELRIRRDNGNTYELDARYENGVAHGRVTNPPKPEVTSARPFPASTVDQRLDWAAMMSSRLAPGEAVAFHVSDPDSGLTPVRGEALGRERITVPAGTYEVLRLRYRMLKADGPETYDIMVTPDAPRLMVREDFPNGAVTELIEAGAIPPEP